MAFVPRPGDAGLRYETLDLDKRVARKTVLAGYGIVQQGVVAPGGTMLAGSSPFKPQTQEHAFYQVSIDLKTGKQKEHWTSYYSSEYPAFSSDGRYLASVVWRSGRANPEIGVVDFATGKELILPHGPFDMAYAPAWKPKTAELFAVGVSQGSAAVYSISVDGKSWSVIWKPGTHFFSKSMEHHPTKDVVAFSGSYGNDQGAFLLNLRDGSVARILDFPTNRLRFSPRGDVVAFDTRTRGGSLGYYATDTKRLVMLRELGNAIYPSWVHPTQSVVRPHRR